MTSGRTIAAVLLAACSLAACSGNPKPEPAPPVASAQPTEPPKPDQPDAPPIVPPHVEPPTDVACELSSSRGFRTRQVTRTCAEAAVERARAIQRQSECEEVQRQKERQQQTGEAMNDERREARVASVGAHPAHVTTAQTARRPIAINAAARTSIAASRLRPRQRVQSLSTLRTPIGACTDITSTKRP